MDNRLAQNTYSSREHFIYVQWAAGPSVHKESQQKMYWEGCSQAVTERVCHAMTEQDRLARASGLSFIRRYVYNSLEACCKSYLALVGRD